MREDCWIIGRMLPSLSANPLSILAIAASQNRLPTNFRRDETEGEVSSCCDGLCRPSAGRSSSSHQPVPVAVVASVEAKNTSLLYAHRRQKHFSTIRPYVKNTSLLYARRRQKHFSTIRPHVKNSSLPYAHRRQKHFSTIRT